MYAQIQAKMWMTIKRIKMKLTIFFVLLMISIRALKAYARDCSINLFTLARYTRYFSSRISFMSSKVSDIKNKGIAAAASITKFLFKVMSDYLTNLFNKLSVVKVHRYTSNIHLNDVKRKYEHVKPDNACLNIHAVDVHK